MFSQPHTSALGSENARTWKAPGGIECMAVREPCDGGSAWTLVSGPENLVGRSWRHIRDLRAAVKATRSAL